jgi:hypothetical protein
MASLVFNEKALKKFQIIAPLLEESLDKAEAFNLRLKLAEEHGLDASNFSILFSGGFGGSGDTYNLFQIHQDNVFIACGFI